MPVVQHRPRPEAVPADDEWASWLKSCRLRTTPARVVVLSALADAGHGTPEQIYAAAAPVLPGLNLSTVYRTLAVLAEHGAISHTHLGGHAPSYMLTSHADHAHLVCRSCHAVTELDPDVAAGFDTSIRTAHGFAVDRGHLSVFGTCSACSIA
jgi:Fur family ferric uptake transcriptional regulator